MIPYNLTSPSNVAPHLSDVATRADAAVADNSRGVNVECSIVGKHLDRFEPDMAGHRATELTPQTEAA